MTPDQDVADAARLAIPAAARVGYVRGWLALRRAKAGLRRRQEEARRAHGIAVVPATVPVDDEDKWFYREAAE